jgi:hypothetical protein
MEILNFGCYASTLNIPILETPMVKHIVMFKLTDNTPENLENAINALNGMKGNIETLRFLEVGKNYSKSDRSYDLVLTTHFDDRNGLEIYASHKNHLPVIKLIKSLCSHSVVVDYEFN